MKVTNLNPWCITFFLIIVSCLCIKPGQCSDDSQNSWSIAPRMSEKVLEDCSDTDGEFYVKLVDKNRTCEWATKLYQRMEFRCSLSDVKRNCCASCANIIVDETGFIPKELYTCERDAIETGTFWIESLQQMRSCKWALFDAEKKRFRCSIPEVSKYCCETCEDY
mmetsp:Transcript_4987/g.5510  ORF Transcript_4987/g.5510 Transcript_4987/m.5510 type:complete len:165 (+) Transcript_4987:87-581(+)